NSTNGIFLGARRIKHHVLQDGDEIQLGEHRLVYRDRVASFAYGERDRLDETGPLPGEWRDHVPELRYAEDAASDEDVRDDDELAEAEQEDDPTDDDVREGPPDDGVSYSAGDDGRSLRDRSLTADAAHGEA